MNAVILSKSNINIVAVDTLHSAEIKDKINAVLERIIGIINEKQYVIMFFGEQLDTKKFSNNVRQTLGAGKESLFGADI